MKKAPLVLIALVLFPILLVSNGTTKTDSILTNQVKATNEIREEIKMLTKELMMIGMSISYKDSISPSVLKYSINEISSKNENHDSVTQKINSLRNEEKSDSGFNFWAFFSAVFAAFIGAAAVIGIFFLQTKIDKKKEQLKHEKERTEKINYLSSLLQSSIDLGEKQIRGFMEFCNEIDSDPINIPLIPIDIIQDIERLSKVFDNEEYYHSFLGEFGNSPKNVKLYRKLANNVDFLLKEFGQILDMQRKNQILDTERKRKYGSLLDVVRDEVLVLGEKYQITQKGFSDFILKTFDSHDSGLTNENRMSINYYENTLVAPLKKGFIGEFSRIPEAGYFVQRLKRLSSIYNEIPIQNKAQADVYKGLFDIMDKAIGELKVEGKEVLNKLNTVGNNP